VNRFLEVSTSAAAVAVLALGGTAIAQSSSSTAQVVACVHKTNGAVRIVGDPTKLNQCGNNEREVRWNEQGVKGDAGAPGATGGTGAKGDQGVQGDQGETGATGETGAKGDQGDTGATGAAGAKGEQGETGATGAAGAKGDQGQAGAKGETGARGETGAKGDKGDKGDAGVSGYQRLEGAALSFPTANTATVACPAGTKVVGGGANVVGEKLILQSSFPATDSTWTVRVSRHDGSSTGTFTPFAICIGA
jgi:hypothetical protein